MSTIATDWTKRLAKEWEKLYPSAVCSGIVGDLAHRARGGYHISRQDQPKTNYSVVRPQDKAGNGPDNAAAAIDMTMSSADMKVCTTRILSAYGNPDDPRRKYLNAFNGWLGSGDARRYDIYARTSSWATADHKWHVHLEIRRLFVNAEVAVKAILSLLRGESVSAYLASIGATPAPATARAAVKAVKAPPYPGRVLKRNDRQAKPDPAVKLLQQRFLERGWKSIGTADGFFGARTESVVRRWQEYLGLAVDGQVGPKTWPTPWTKPVAG